MNDVNYSGDATLREPVLAALAGVVDPEMSLGIVDIGLVYGVDVAVEGVHVTMTMTSPACPVTDVIADEIEIALREVLPDARPIDVELVWEPAWTPDRMSERARDVMGW
jgi:metal-sulfur cluster biosynthetic enzyme